MIKLRAGFVGVTAELKLVCVNRRRWMQRQAHEVKHIVSRGHRRPGGGETSKLTTTQVHIKLARQVSADVPRS